MILTHRHLTVHVDDQPDIVNGGDLRSPVTYTQTLVFFLRDEETFDVPVGRWTMHVEQLHVRKDAMTHGTVITVGGHGHRLLKDGSVNGQHVGHRIEWGTLTYDQQAVITTALRDELAQAVKRIEDWEVQP